AGQRLGGERLVELHHGQVAPADSGAAQGGLGGLDGADAEDVRVHGGHPAADDAGQRFAADPFGRGGVPDEQGGRAVVEGGGVARGDGAVGAERGFEGGQLLRGGLPDALVPVQLRAGHLGDLGGEGPLGPRAGGAFVAAQREGVLLGAVDAV